MLPNIESHQADIISRFSIATGMDVSVHAIRGGWAGLRPYVELEDVVFLEPASSTSLARPAGAIALKLPRLTAELSWWSLIAGQVRFAEIVLDGPELAISRNQDGFIYFAGRALNQPKSTEDDGQLLTFLLEQPGLAIRNATLTWNDELTPGSTLRFTEVGLQIKKRGSGHRLGFTAAPPVRLARKIDANGDLQLDNVDGHWIVKGTLYTAATDASLTELRQHAPVPTALQTGIGNLRAWIEIDNTITPLSVAASPASSLPAPVSASTASVFKYAAFNPIRAITADLHLINVRAQLDTDLAPLNIAKLAGRIEYKAQEGGFMVGSKALEILTREGVVLPPTDFSLTLQHQNDVTKAKGEISGNDIDLKVMAALMESFPVSKDLRGLATRYQPRGLVKNTVFAWSGFLEKPSGYHIKSTLKNFGLNSDGKNPGVTDFSGTIEGDDKGGKFNIASKMLVLDEPHIFRAPLKFDTFDSTGKWRVNQDATEVDFSNVNFANADLTGEFSGLYSRLRSSGARATEEKGPGSVDIKGKFSHVKASAVGQYLPNGIARTRSYLEHALQDGEMTSATFQLKGELYEFPFRNGKGGTFTARAAIKDVDFRYNDDWPAVNNINGVLSFDNTKFGLAIDAAKILNTNIKRSSIAIADLNDKTGLIAINLTADARAEEVAKFLRESPLANTVGGFTKVVAMDGYGKLDLGLAVPLVAGTGVIKVNGKYALLRATAKPVVGPTVTNLTGMIVFTERGVQSTSLAGASGSSLNGPAAATGNALQGIAYGNPVTITVNGGGDTGVTTEFTARADMAQLAEVLPFRLPQQVSGTTEFHGKILARADTTEIVIDSNLAGVVSTLPYPLAKRANEPRQLRVQFVNVAQPVEQIHVTLAGNASQPAAGAPMAAPALAASVDQPDTRIDARFQRRFDAAGTPVALLGGVATIGAAGDPAAAMPIPEGIWFTGRLKQFDLDLWRAAFEGFYASSTTAPLASTQAVKNESLVAGFDFKLGGLIAYGRQFKGMTLKGRHGAEDWRFVVDSPEASGDVTWRPGAFNDRGSVRARLKNFVLVDEAINPASISAAADQNKALKNAEFPALDIVAEQFTLKDRWMGKLELRANPQGAQGANWKIDQLTISNGHVRLDMDGIWQHAAEPERLGQVANTAGRALNNANERSQTTVNIKLESSNLNALFAQFGFGDYLRGGTAKLEGKLAWPGHVYQMQLVNLSGNFKVGARNGQFAKIEPGAGKLLGLISLQSLPRRITLDFRDIFSQGFAFNSIDGDVKVKDGIMFTENFQVVGPAADVKMAGDVSLPSERQNLIMTVLPKLDESVAIGAGLATLNPVVGLAVYLGQKVLQNPVEKIFSYRYVVSGSWDNPQVDRINRNGTLIPSADSATPVTPAPTPPASPASNLIPTPNPAPTSAPKKTG